MLTAIRQWVLKTMMKDQTGVMRTLPKKDLIDFNVQMTAERLARNGFEPSAFKNANQVENAINQIEAPKNVQQGIKSTKSADVFDLKGKKIKNTDNIMGGEELPPPGSRGGPDDIAAPIQSSEETIKNMVESELMKTDNPFSDLVKTTDKGPKTLAEREAEILARMEKDNKETVARIKNRKIIKDAIDNASTGFVRGDRKYNAQLVAEDLAEKKFGKKFSDLEQKQQMDLYGEALDGLDDSDKFAQGGRAGFKSGLGKGFLEFLEKFRVKQSGDDLKDFLSKRQFMKDIIGNTEKNKKARELKMLKEAMEDARKNPGFEFPSGKELRTELEKKIGPILLKDRKLNAQGGRAGFKDGLLSMLDVQAAGSKSGKQQIKGAPEGFTQDSEVINAIVKLDIPFDEKINLLADYSYGKNRTRIGKDDQEIFLDEGGFKNRNVGLEFNRSGEGFGGKIMYNLESGEPQLNLKFKKSFASGGRAGYKFGIGPLLELLSKTSPKQAYTKYLQSVKDRAQKGDMKSLVPELGAVSATGIFVNRRMKDVLENMKNQDMENTLENYIKELDADPFYKDYPDLKDKMIEGYTEMMFGEGRAEGGRIGLKDGMDRRTFMKIMAGLASIPIVGKIFKGAKVASKAAPIAKNVTKSTPPPYFFELAETIKKFGKPDKVTYADRVEVHRYTGKNGDEYELIEDLNTGDMRIQKDKTGIGTYGDKSYDTINDRSVMEYKKGDVNVDPDKKIASKTPDEYDEYKIEFDVDGTEAEADDMSEFIRKEIIEEVNQQAPKIKKAAGGVAYMLGE